MLGESGSQENPDSATYNGAICYGAKIGGIQVFAEQHMLTNRAALRNFQGQVMLRPNCAVELAMLHTHDQLLLNVTQQGMHRTIMFLKKKKKKFSHRAIVNCGPDFWNSLDRSIKQSINNKGFKNKLKSNLLSEYK